MKGLLFIFSMLRRSKISMVVPIIMLCSGDALCQKLPQPPKQAQFGPGGTEYIHSGVSKNIFGKRNREYWIFRPSSPTPETSPIIIFLHGWGATNPKIYGAWIEHIVRKGNMVIYPRYQATLFTPSWSLTHNAIQAVKDAIGQLRKETDITPEFDNVAIVGHSVGGQIAANMAALAGKDEFPLPKAVMCVQPGKSESKQKSIAVRLADLSSVPAHTLLLTVVGEDDLLVGDNDGKLIFNKTTQVPLTNKDFIIMVSDRYGAPSLNAHHFAPCAINDSYGLVGKRGQSRWEGLKWSRLEEQLKDRRDKREKEPADFLSIDLVQKTIDSLDYYGFWKLFDGLCDAAFYGTNREYALGDTPEQRFMGNWSDGTPVKELMVTDTP